MAVGEDGNVRGLLTSQLKPTEEGLLAGGMLKRPTLENSEQSDSYLEGVSQAWTLYEDGQYTGGQKRGSIQTAVSICSKSNIVLCTGNELQISDD